MYHGEKLNAWTHLVGAVAAFIGGVWMLVIASLDGSPWKIVSVAIYAFTLLVLYSASTVYHSVRGRKKAIMQKVDHFSIYLLIAGSYTPFCLVTLRGPWGWTLFGIVWGLALIGILQEIKPRSEARLRRRSSAYGQSSISAGMRRSSKNLITKSTSSASASTPMPIPMARLTNSPGPVNATTPPARDAASASQAGSSARMPATVASASRASSRSMRCTSSSVITTP